MKELNTENLKEYIKKNGVPYQPLNCLLEACIEDSIRVKDIISAQINDSNWEHLTKEQAFEIGFEELADWATDDAYIIAVELEQPIEEEYYISICVPKSDFELD